MAEALLENGTAMSFDPTRSYPSPLPCVLKANPAPAADDGEVVERAKEVETSRHLEGQSSRNNFADVGPDEAEEIQASKCLTVPGGNEQADDTSENGTLEGQDACNKFDPPRTDDDGRFDEANGRSEADDQDQEH